jgi:hypothetical protein
MPVSFVVRHRPGSPTCIPQSFETLQEQHTEGSGMDDIKRYGWQCQPDTGRNRQRIGATYH